jgi:branched-chain amino acid transport system substrate-binding protein
MSRKFGIAASAALAASLVLSACASTNGGSSGSGTGAGDPITIGSIGALSGPDAALGSAVRVIQAYFQNVDAEGGINGHKVNVVLGDDQFNPANTPGVVRQLVQQNHISLLCGTTGSPDNTAIAPYLKSEGIPSISTSGSSDLIDPASSTQYEFLPTYNPLAAQLVEYAVKVLHKKRIAVLYSDDDTGLPALAGAKAELAKLHMPLAASVVFSQTATTLATQAAQLKAAKVDFVIAWAIPTALALFVNNANQIGYRPTVGGPFFAQSAAFSSAAGSVANNNAYFATSMVAATSAAAKPITQVLKKYYSAGSVTDVSLMEGWAAADTCAAALRAATAGKKALTTSGLQKALNSLTLNDQYVHDLKWTSTDHGGVTQAQITKLSGGKFVPVTGFQTLPDVPES